MPEEQNLAVNEALDELNVHADNEPPVVPFAGLPDIAGDNDEGPLVPAANNAVAVAPRGPITIPIGQPETLRQYLIKHFDVSYRLGRIQWPKCMQTNARKRFRMATPVTGYTAIMRALAFIHDALYVKESDLRREGRTPGNYAVYIGRGLFSSLPFREGDVIADFVGEYITHEEGRTRDELGKGGYQVYLNVNYLLDCYPYLDRCKASMANSPYKCKNIVTGAMAVSNCKLSYDLSRKRVRLVATTKDIGPHTEILWNYGQRYHRYPTLPEDS
jgi:hypothetical protein